MLCKCLLAFSVGVDDSIEMEKMGIMIFLQMNWIYFCNCFEIPAHLMFGLRRKKDQGDHTLWRTTESRGWIRERAVSSKVSGQLWDWPVGTGSAVTENKVFRNGSCVPDTGMWLFTGCASLELVTFWQCFFSFFYMSNGDQCYCVKYDIVFMMVIATAKTLLNAF